MYRKSFYITSYGFYSGVALREPKTWQQDVTYPRAEARSDDFPHKVVITIDEVNDYFRSCLDHELNVGKYRVLYTDGDDSQYARLFATFEVAESVAKEFETPFCYADLYPLLELLGFWHY